MWELSKILTTPYVLRIDPTKQCMYKNGSNLDSSPKKISWSPDFSKKEVMLLRISYIMTLVIVAWAIAGARHIRWCRYFDGVGKWYDVYHFCFQDQVNRTHNKGSKNDNDITMSKMNQILGLNRTKNSIQQVVGIVI